jgi:hypothetical protein
LKPVGSRSVNATSMVTGRPAATRAGMRNTVAELRRDATTRPSIVVERMSIPPPARAGRGAAAQSRSTISDTEMSGVKTTRSDPVTVPPLNDTVADSRGRFGSGGAYADGHEVLATALGLDRGLAAALAAGLGAIDAVVVSDGDGLSVLLRTGLCVDVVEALQPATSATTTAASRSRQVRTCRR